MFPYHWLWPLIKRLPPEFAHAAGLSALRLPVRFGATIHDPFEFRGLTFRNRAGIAAGFDKNAAAVRGVERLGAGFIEVGTILTKPWGGNRVTPRMARLLPERAIWNRLGFTSEGLEVAVRNLRRVPSERRHGLIVAANIGPHPGHLKGSADPLITARAEFLELVDALQSHCDLLVINLSSPNTPKLRNLLQSPDLVDAVLQPVKARLRELNERMPLLIKLPPEDQDRKAWNEESLRAVVDPLRPECDGFVAVNTSTRLAVQLVSLPPPELPGGVSGEPLRAEALRVVAMLRRLIGPEALLIGCGGVMEPAHAVEFRRAGADLVEMYSGMIYTGPGLVARAADAMRSAK